MWKAIWTFNTLLPLPEVQLRHGGIQMIHHFRIFLQLCIILPNHRPYIRYVTCCYHTHCVTFISKLYHILIITTTAIPQVILFHYSSYSLREISYPSADLLFHLLSPSLSVLLSLHRSPIPSMNPTTLLPRIQK